MKKPLVQKQKPMMQVVYALLPLCAAAVYFYGWRFLLVLIVVNLAGFLAEFAFVRRSGKPVSSAVFVTGMLFALSLPPAIPLWMAVVGIVFGVVFGKMVFGGFGRNVFNPAISGRAFIYISFGYELTGGFFAPVGGRAGGLTVWQGAVDAVTKATPLALQAQGGGPDLLPLLLGNTAGSYGETCAVLILVCGLFLMLRKVASFRIVLGSVAGFALMQGVLWLAGLEAAVDPLSAALAGSFLFAAMFMITDPVSASQTTDPGRWIYGMFYGILVVLIRLFSIWPEAVTFAVLLANMFAPLLDYLIKERKKALKAKKAGEA